MRAYVLIALLATLLMSTGCLASMPVKVAAASNSDGPAKVKELPGGVTLITDEQWDAEVIAASSDFPVVVDMYADWCGPCKRLSPILDEISHENRQVKFVKVDTDKSSKAKNMGINAIPTLIIYKNGSEVNRITGLRAKDELVGIFAAL